MKNDVWLKRWETLLEAGCDEALAGLLCDLFRFVRHTETSWPTNVLPEHRELSQSMKESRWANLREVLMDILEDNDGSKLRNWMALYRTDRSAFRERARQYTRSLNNAHHSGLWLDEENEQEPQ